jgi:hypothetical protein
MNSFDGFFLPQLAPIDVADLKVLRAGALEVRYPALTSAQTADIWRHLLHQRNRVLVKTPVAEIVAAIDAAANVLRGDIDQVVTLVSEATAYSAPVVAETLGHMLDDWSKSSLYQLLAAELGDARVLDHAVPDPRIPGKQIAAFGYPRAFHVFAGNVPGVGVTSLIRSLLVKSATLAKTASGEPVLPILFARALQQVAPDIAACIALSYWPHDAEAQNAALQSADIVVLYGSDVAVTNVRKQMEGLDARIVVHGPRVSFGVVGPNAVSETARSVAHAVAAYDQQGCVSPHVVYVVGDRERARRFAHDVAQQLRELDGSHPRGTISPEEAVAIRNARTAAEFSGTAEVFGSERDRFAVIYDEAPSFEVSCLNRVLYVKPVAAGTDVIHVLPRPVLLQSAAVAGFPAKEKAELAYALGLAGVSRITSFDRLPWPPMHWHHDGSAPLQELVRWQDIEA